MEVDSKKLLLILSYNLNFGCHDLLILKMNLKFKLYFYDALFFKKNKMKNIFVKIILINLLFLSGCGWITIVSGKWEEVEKFKVELDIKPSVFISNYTHDSTYLLKKNYFLTFYDIYCIYSYRQIYTCNELYDSTKEYFEWIALTIYDSIDEKEFRTKKEYNEKLRYKYETYYKINGLKSSLRNLYYRNNIKEPDIVPMNMIIVNDSIVKITRGAIDTKLKYETHKHYLDSLITNSIIPKMNSEP